MGNKRTSSSTETRPVGGCRPGRVHVVLRPLRGPSRGVQPPPPNARVCGSCGLGLLLEARRMPSRADRDAFLVVDSLLLVQAMSRHAETFLGVTEEARSIDKPVAELLVPADAEARAGRRFAAALVEAGRRRPTIRDDTPLRPPVEHVRRPDSGADRDSAGRRARGARGLENHQRPAAARAVGPLARAARSSQDAGGEPLRRADSRQPSPAAPPSRPRCWPFSSSAMIVRPTATAVPFSVWTCSGLPRAAR